MKLYLLQLILLFLGLHGTVHAIEPIETKIEWTVTPPCDPLIFAKEIPNQPVAGLSLFRFSCPNTPTKLISGVKIILLPHYKNNELILKNTPLNVDTIVATHNEWVSNIRDLPIDQSDFISTQSKQNIEKDTLLLSRLFEKRRLWMPMSSIQVQLNMGNVTTTLSATATSQGKFGEIATAKLESGKIISGLALLCQNNPCLKVNP